jgi:hypothetical protein
MVATVDVHDMSRVTPPVSQTLYVSKDEQRGVTAEAYRIGQKYWRVDLYRFESDIPVSGGGQTRQRALDQAIGTWEWLTGGMPEFTRWQRIDNATYFPREQSAAVLVVFPHRVRVYAGLSTALDIKQALYLALTPVPLIAVCSRTLSPAALATLGETLQPLLVDSLNRMDRAAGYDWQAYVGTRWQRVINDGSLWRDLTRQMVQGYGSLSGIVLYAPALDMVRLGSAALQETALLTP